MIKRNDIIAGLFASLIVLLAAILFTILGWHVLDTSSPKVHIVQTSAASESPKIQRIVESQIHCGHKIVCGGVHNVEELWKARQDPVFDSVVAGMNQSKLRFERTQKDQWVYMAYRTGQDLFWTHNKVFVPKGEAVFTDGQIYILERCGNIFEDWIGEVPGIAPTPTTTEQPEIDLPPTIETTLAALPNTLPETAAIPIFSLPEPYYPYPINYCCGGVVVNEPKPVNTPEPSLAILLGLGLIPLLAASLRLR